MGRKQREAPRQEPPRVDPPKRTDPPRRDFSPSSQGGTQLGGDFLPRQEQEGGVMYASAESLGDSNAAIQDLLKGGGALA